MVVFWDCDGKNLEDVFFRFPAFCVRFVLKSRPTSSHVDSHIFEIAVIIGSLAFALSGVLMGIRKDLDIMGVFILAFLTANGGGILRDLIIDRPPAVLVSLMPLWLTSAVVVGSWVLKIQRSSTLDRTWVFVISDSVGLVAFSITGGLVGIEEGLHFFGVIILSFLTATGGGIVRDLLVNEVPLVLRTDFYGTIALLLGVAVYLLYQVDAVKLLTLSVLFAVGLLVRLTAYKYKWQLPKLR
jgi:uncharacterized membrane protein YeiH